MPNAPITAAEFARDAIKELESRKRFYLDAANCSWPKRNALVMQAEQWKEAAKAVRDLAAKHGVKMEGGE